MLFPLFQCFSPLGDTLFGYTVEEEDRLSCECSRKFWELENALADGDFDTAAEASAVPEYMG